MIDISFSIPDSEGPAFRAVVQEMRNTIGDRLTGNHPFKKEAALTAAASAVGALAAAVNSKVAGPKEVWE